MAGHVRAVADLAASDAVLRHGAVDLAALKQSIQKAGSGFHFVELPLADCPDKASALKRVGEVLRFPGYYGVNLDAMMDCLRDLPDTQHWAGKGLVVHVASFSHALPHGVRGSIMEVFTDAAEELKEAEKQYTLRVISP